MKYHLNMPLQEEDVRKLKCGDVVFLSGIVYQATGSAQKRVLEMYRKGERLPFDLENSAVYHNYSSFTKDGDRFKLNYLGATTSALMNPLQPDVIRNFKVRAIIGKGGMDKSTLDAMHEVGCVFLAQVGGCSALYSPLAMINAGYWEDLGGNLVLALELFDFGPLTVAMDANNNSIFSDVEKAVTKNLKKIKGAL